MKIFSPKLVVWGYILSTFFACNLSTPKPAETSKLKDWVYKEAVTNNPYLRSERYSMKKEFIQMCRNSAHKYKGFEKDPEAPYSIFEFSLWRFEKDIKETLDGEINYTDNPASSIGYFYENSEYNSYDLKCWANNELDSNSILYKQKEWADDHEEKAREIINEILLPNYKKYIQEIIDKKVKIINWDLSANGQGDSYTSYLVTYEVSNENQSQYILVNLIEFDDGRWSAQIEYNNASLQELNSLIN